MGSAEETTVTHTHTCIYTQDNTLLHRPPAGHSAPWGLIEKTIQKKMKEGRREEDSLFEGGMERQHRPGGHGPSLPRGARRLGSSCLTQPFGCSSGGSWGPPRGDLGASSKATRVWQRLLGCGPCSDQGEARPADLGECGCGALNEHNPRAQVQGPTSPVCGPFLARFMTHTQPLPRLEPCSASVSASLLCPARRSLTHGLFSRTRK